MYGQQNILTKQVETYMAENPGRPICAKELRSAVHFANTTAYARAMRTARVNDPRITMPFKGIYVFQPDKEPDTQPDIELDMEETLGGLYEITEKLDYIDGFRAVDENGTNGFVVLRESDLKAIFDDRALANQKRMRCLRHLRDIQRIAYDLTAKEDIPA